MDGREGRLARLAYEVAVAEDVDELRAVVTHGLRTIVDADLASYTEVSPRTGQALALIDHPVIASETGAARLAELADQHPLIVRRSPRAEAISDHLTARQFRGLELYQDVYRGLGAVDQLAVTITHDDDVVVGLALNRSRPGFSEADRRALEALGAVVRDGLSRVIARSRGRELLAALERNPLGADAGVIALSGQGRAEFVSDRARRWLRAYFPDERGPGLPAGLNLLIEEPAAITESLAVAGPEGTLEIRPLPAAFGEPRLLELREHRRAPMAGLTAREREILTRIALGDSNAAVAAVLGISSRTVENHLRAIYRKLGVSSRTAAVARVRD